jgi:N-acetyl-anhydromuramyl-L-alanine amidase AmpD
MPRRRRSTITQEMVQELLTALKSAQDALAQSIARLEGEAPEVVARELIVPRAVPPTNQDVINAFYRAARSLGEDGWGLLNRAGLTMLVRDRVASYQGPPIELLPGLTPREKAAIQAALGPLPPPPPGQPEVEWVGPTVNHDPGRDDHSIDLIVVHYTASGSAASTIAWFKNPAALVSAHYILDHDGELYQIVKDEDTAWHAGIAPRPGLSPAQNAARRVRNGKILANPRGIGIEIVNWGPLTKVNGSFQTWTGRVFNGPVIEAQGGYWEAFTDAQYTSLITLVGWLSRKYNMPVQYPPQGPGTYEPNADVLAKFRGILGHDAIDNTKQDPGPAFDWERLKVAIQE